MVNSTRRHRHLDSARYETLRRALLRVKGSIRQREFLAAVRIDSDFLDYLAESVGVTTGHSMSWSCKLTEREFLDPPEDTERQIYEEWRDLARGVACRPSFWGATTLDLIRSGHIRSSFLATPTATRKSGLVAIDEVLAGANGPGPEESAKGIDTCVRTVIRRFSGLPGVRGNRSVFVNCPFARAWWRGRMGTAVLRVIEESEGSSDLEWAMVQRPLRQNQQYWENIVSLIVSRNSVLGSSRVQAAMVASLATLLSRDPQTPLKYAVNLRPVFKNLSALSTARELSLLEFHDLRRLTDDIVAFHDKRLRAPAHDGEE